MTQRIKKNINFNYQKVHRGLMSKVSDNLQACYTYNVIFTCQDNFSVAAKNALLLNMGIVRVTNFVMINLLEEISCVFLHKKWKRS